MLLGIFYLIVHSLDCSIFTPVISIHRPENVRNAGECATIGSFQKQDIQHCNLSSSVVTPYEHSSHSVFATSSQLLIY